MASTGVPVGTSAITARDKVSLESLVEMQRKLYDLAYDSKQVSAGFGAVREISVLTGHRIERSEIARSRCRSNSRVGFAQSGLERDLH